MTNLSNSNLYLDLHSLGGDFLLISIAPYFSYKDGVRQTDVEGYKYTVVLPHHKFEQLDVKIPGAQQLDLDADSLPVQFRNLRVRPYLNRERNFLSFTAQADQITCLAAKP